MDEALKKSGDYPNIALTPGTHRHAATGEAVEIPASARMDGTCDMPFCEQVDRWLHGDAPSECRECSDGKYGELTALVDNRTWRYMGCRVNVYNGERNIDFDGFVTPEVLDAILDMMRKVVDE